MKDAHNRNCQTPERIDFYERHRFISNLLHLDPGDLGLRPSDVLGGSSDKNRDPVACRRSETGFDCNLERQWQLSREAGQRAAAPSQVAAGHRAVTGYEET